MQELASALRTEHDCWIVAPDGGRSCCSHGVTNAQQLRVRKRDANGWDVSGTPADCVRIAIHSLGLVPDLVISGVNHGGNLGIDTLFSGTVAAAREASILGFPAIAISQYMKLEVPRDWSQTAYRAHNVLKDVWSRPIESGYFWNINLPVIPPETTVGQTPYPIIDCELESAPLAFELHLTVQTDPLTDLETDWETHTYDYISNYQKRPRSDNSDVAHCFSGKATVTRLKAFPA